MSTPKKIIIRLNRSANQSKLPDSELSPAELTEWNIPRVLMALGLILVFIVLPFYLLNGDSGQEKYSAASQKEGTTAPIDSVSPNSEQIAQSESPTAAGKSKEEDKEANNGSGQSSTIKHHGVTRALLAKGLNGREPMGEISLPIKVNKNNATGVFYFTEINNMKGRIMYHQWLREGKSIYKKTLKVADDNFRIATPKLFPYSADGKWTVRLIDKAGKIYNEINFDVVKE